jgi:REP element-mobilizing transposase RayT
MSSNTYSSIWLHLVWSTKDRNPLLQKRIRHTVFNTIRKCGEDINIAIDHINGVDDHIHVLASVLPTHAASTVVKHLKGPSSKWINDQQLCDEYFEWQVGFSAFSVSPTQLDKVRAYIRNQEQHHAKTTFADEMKELERIASSY